MKRDLLWFLDDRYINVDKILYIVIDKLFLNLYGFIIYM